MILHPGKHYCHIKVEAEFHASVWKFTGVPYRIRGLVFKNNAELPILRQFRTKNHAV